jgi:hypothetical protein
MATSCPKPLEFAKPAGDFFRIRQFMRFELALIRQLEFLELIANRRDMSRAQPIDEERAIQVIRLMLNDAGHQTFHFAADFIAIQIVGLNLYLGVSSHGSANAWNAQTALFVLLLPAAAAKNWVDEYTLSLLRIRVAMNVGHEQPIRQINLVGGQSNAFVLIHQLEHFGDNFSQFRIHAPQRFRRVPQRRVRILNNL